MLDVAKAGSESPLIDLKDVSRSFAKANGDKLVVLENVDLTINSARDRRAAGPVRFRQIHHASDHRGPCQTLVGRGHVSRRSPSTARRAASRWSSNPSPCFPG